jgi:hypothetical protein
MTAESSQPRLLTLPREVRNLIYGYLTREVELRGIDKIGDKPTIVTIGNAPYVNVLLTHSRLHEEYKESSRFSQVSATATHRNVPPEIADADWITDVVTVERDQTALRHVRIATIQYAHTTPDSMKGDEVTGLVTDLVEAIPVLHTVRLLQETVLLRHDSSCPPLPFPSISTTTHTLSLVQLATCMKHIVIFKNKLSDEVGLERAREGKAVIQWSGVLLLSVYSSQSSRVNSWVPEGVKEWSQPLRVEKFVRDRTPPDILEELQASRSRVTRIVNWKEEDCDLYNS